MDFRNSPHILRLARQVLGPDRILHVHRGKNPLNGPTICCPFIEGYADVLPRGEVGRGGLSRENFIRCVLRGYNFSNAGGLRMKDVSIRHSSLVIPAPSAYPPLTADWRSARFAPLHS